MKYLHPEARRRAADRRQAERQRREHDAHMDQLSLERQRELRAKALAEAVERLPDLPQAPPVA